MAAHDDKFRVLRKLPEVRFEEELRGYSKGQVDRVLQSIAPLADDVEALQQRLSAAERRAAAGEARATAAEARLAEAARGPVGGVAPVAEAPLAPPPDFDETLSKTLLLAQRTADQVVAEAQAEAASILAAARAEAEAEQAAATRLRQNVAEEVATERRRLMAEAHDTIQAKVAAAETALSEAEGATRRQLADEITDLGEVRSGLAGEIEELEGHLAQRREAIKAALADIAAIIEDPQRLHSEMPPVVSGLAAPAAASGEVILDVPGVDELAPADGDAGADGGPEAAAPGAARVVSAQLLGEADDEGSASLAGLADPAPGLGPLDAGAETAVDLADGGPPTEAIEAVIVDTETDSRSDIDRDPGGDADSGLGPTPSLDLAGDSDSAPFPSGGVIEGEAGDDETERAMEDWIVGESRPASSGQVSYRVVLDEATEAPAHAGAPEVHDVVDLGRPAWADAVPDVTELPAPPMGEDPFLDELRRATSEGSETDEALERFLADHPDESRRSGWFNRRK